VITPEERKKLNCSDKIFYVGVATEHSTSYVLYSWILAKKIIKTEFNVPISGDVVKDEIINYSVKLYEYDKTVEFTVELDSHSGSSSLFIKRCKSRDDESPCVVYKFNF
jgi:hypothetical protein